MQDIRRFMRWIFAATSVPYLLIYLPTFLWSVHRRPYDLLFLDNLLAGTLFSVVPIVCGVACWVIWKGKPSARGWGIAASLMHIVIFLRANHSFLPIRVVAPPRCVGHRNNWTGCLLRVL